MEAMTSDVHMAVPVDCPTCGQTCERVVTDTASVYTARAVIACPAGHEWLLTINLSRIGDGRTGRQDRIRPGQLNASYAQARQAVHAGQSISDACAGAGITTRSYYACRDAENKARHATERVAS